MTLTCRDFLRESLARRPLWMNALMLFCAFMAAVYVPWDLLSKPLAEDVEVWLGIRFRGWAAKATEPLRLAIYAAGAVGFWRMSAWMWPWASIYAAQVALSMAVWALVHALPERGVLPALVSGGVGVALFGSLAIALWRARDRFRPAPA